MSADVSNYDYLSYLQKTTDDYNKSKGTLNDTSGYNCDICHNKGLIAHIMYDDLYGEYRNYYETCKCMNTRIMLQQMRESGLSKNVLDKYTFEAYKTSESWQKTVKLTALKYLQADGKPWFFIGGVSGCGKSHICTAIASEFLKQGKSVTYMPWRDEAVVLKSTVMDVPETYKKKMDRYKSTECLYIDDFFKAGRNKTSNITVTSADINIAFEIINSRYVNNLQTIISSELALNEIFDIDTAIHGRIVEMVDGFKLNIKGGKEKNYRLKGTIEL